MGLLITFVLGLFIVAGALVAQHAKDHARIEHISVAVAAGAMAALVVLDLIPEALEELPDGKWFLLPVFLNIGILLLKLLDAFVPEHEGHGAAHIGIVSTIAIVLHNIIEGMAVYSMTGESARVGALMALGVGLHNIPMGMMIGSTLQEDRHNRMVILLTLAAVSTFVGGVLMHFLWTHIGGMLIGALISMTLGMILYIECFELVPHLLRAPDRRRSVIGALAGIAVVAVSTLLG